MLGTRVCTHYGHVSRTSVCKVQPWRCWAFTLLGFIALLCSGCPEPVPLQLSAGVPDALSLPQARQQLRETLMRALQPEILDVEVTADFIVYRYRQPIAVPLARPITENRIALLNIGRVEAYTNNVVLIWTPSNILLGQIIFGNYQDPKTCAALLLSLRDYRAQRS